MKTSAKLAAALLLTAAYACQSDLDEKAGETKASPVCITASDNTQHLKTNLKERSVSWIAGVDKLGVYSPQARPSAGQTAGVTNAAFTAASSGTSSAFSGSMYWGAGNHTFYAYYPYNAKAGVNANKVPITLPAYQLQEGTTNNHIGSLDFLVATPVKVQSGNENAGADVDFKMNHAFTMLQFYISASNFYKGAKLYQISFKAEKNISLASGTIDITQPTPAGAYTIAEADGGNTVVLNIKGDCVLDSNTPSTPTASMMILPVDLSGYNPTSITVTTDKGVCVIKKTGMNFERGKVYNVNLEQLSFDNTKTTDFDGNLYTSVKIGNYYWFQQNLKTTRLNDGTPLSLFSTELSPAQQPAYDWCAGSIANKDSYGALYNFYAATETKLCPRGWHIPSYSEWNDLISSSSIKQQEFLIYGGYFNVESINGTKFLVYRNKDAEGWWWSSTKGKRDICKNNSGINFDPTGRTGQSILCVRD